MARLLTPSEQLTIEAPYGSSIQSILDSNIAKDFKSHTLVFLNGNLIKDYEVTVTYSDSLLLAVIPQGGGGGGGGKNPLAAVLTIAVVIAAVAITGGAAAGLLGAGTLAAGSTGAMVLAAGVSLIGTMAISALCPPPPISTGDTGSYGGSVTESNTYSIAGQSNTMRKYGAVNRVYGRHKVSPTIAANPLISNIGTDSRISALYDFGLGNIQIENLQIGDVDITTFSPEVAIYQNSLVTSTKYVSRRVGYDQFSYLLKANSPLTVDTKTETIGFDVDLSFARGLCYYDNNGNPTNTSIQIWLEYRLKGSGSWIRVHQSQISGANISGGIWDETVTTGGDRYVAGEDGWISNGGYTSDYWGNDVWNDNLIPPGTLISYGADGTYTSKPMRAGGMSCSNGEFGDPTPGTYKACYVGGTSSIVHHNDPITISNSTAKPFVVSVSVGNLAPGEYEFKATRITGDNTNTRYSNDVSLTMIKSYQSGTVVNLNKRHTMLEMRILATDKISGVVQNLSAIATSILRTTTNGVNFTDRATRNPAWIAIDILTGEGNPKPLPDDHIDWPSWIRLANFCEAKGYKCDVVIDYVTTVQELLNSVLSGCRASILITTGGKYGVLIDEEKSVPRQLLTPANSWNFSGSRSFPDYPHALRVTFINPDLNWQKDERIVYADGYNASNATIFDTLNTFGITDKDQAWKYGRYMLAQGIQRSELFSITMDVENLVVQRGDLVHVANDVVKIGGMPCRVVMISGGNIIVNTELSTQPTGYSVRLSDGTVRTGAVTASISGHEFTLDNMAGIQSDDLVVLGEMNRVVQPYLVQAINAGADLTAELTLCKYAPGVYHADTGAIPPWNPGFGDDMINHAGSLKVINLTAKQTLFYKERLPFSQIDLNWAIDGFNAGGSDIYYSVNGGKQIMLGSTEEVTQQMIIDLLHDQSMVGVPITFEVIPHTKGGIQGQSAKVTITPLPDTAPPSDIDGFSVNIQDMLVEIFWDAPKDKDIDRFELRYSPDAVNGSWNASQMLGILPYNITKTSAGARTGKYFLQAIDTSGNRSNIAWQRTTVERLPNVNQIKVVNDQPLAWPGALSDVVKDAAGRITSGGNFGSINPVGYYYFSDFAQFDQIYEVRVRSKIVAYGVDADDIMARWVPLASAKPLARASSSQWNCQLQVRTSDAVMVMAKWLPLSSAVPLSMSNTVWSEWRNVTVSDITGRVLQFRIKIESFDPHIKAVLVDGRVEIDSTDWTWNSADQIIPAGGKDILFSTPFMDVPAISVSIDGTDIATEYVITNKTRAGFSLKLLDAAGVSVSGKVDLAALGQGRQRLVSI